MTPSLVYCCVIVVLSHVVSSQPPFVATGLDALESMIRLYRRDSQPDLGRNRDTPGKKIIKQGTYDFIVIGAGTAGSVVANRLSENPDWTFIGANSVGAEGPKHPRGGFVWVPSTHTKSYVLLLEAGQDESILNEIPALTSFFALTDSDWGYATEPQSNACLAMTGRRCVWPRGKMLGGTSSINHMIYSRGSRHDYDAWASLGNKGWSYEEVLPYFKKSENVHLRRLKKSEYHATGGYLSVEDAPYHTTLGNAFLRAGAVLGYNVTADYNGEQEIGFSHNQVLMRDGLRCSASKSFLRPIRHRRNLHVSLNSRVSRILVDPSTRQTRGVVFTKNRLLYTVMVGHEVVLSAGALNSPQVLMLSGIGPADHLKELGIPVVQNLKVGHNLQDHPGFLGLTFLVNNKTKSSILQAQRIESMLQFVVNGTGPITSSAGTESLAFVRTKYAEDARPDVEFLYVGTGLNSDGGGPFATKGVGLDPVFYEQVYRTIDKKNVWSIIPIVLHPRSRGTVKLKDTNPFHHPVFDPRTFSDPYDLKVLVEGIKLALKVADSKPFRKFGSRLHSVPLPGCRKFSFGSDDYWECACRYLTGATHHQMGTCKMGPATDRDAVVDPELRVYGVKGLRVADASVIPLEVSGHTSAPAYMIGEKVSDLIKASYSVNL